MFGFASDETEGFEDLEGMFMPLPAALAQLLTSKMSASMKDGTLPWARPDSKSQVTIRYDDDGHRLRSKQWSSQYSTMIWPKRSLKEMKGKSTDTSVRKSWRGS